MARDLNQALRPRDWDHVVGQGDTKDIVLKAIHAGNFPKFSIFTGPTGVGKSCMAELVAKSLLCTATSDKPCGKCQGCLTHSERSIIKYNMASLLGKKDIVSILEGIFKYEGVDSTTVYILEEVQVLKKNEEQAPFLEELTRIPDGVYVMMCTTQASKLLPELRNRALTFQLTIPTIGECVEYIQDILETIHCKPMSVGGMYSLAALSEYTPRNIVKYIELLSIDGEISELKMSQFFKTVSKITYIELLDCIMDNGCNLHTYARIVKDMAEKIGYSKLLSGLKDFALTALIEMCLGSADPTISKSERNKMVTAMSRVTEQDFTRLVDRLGDIVPDVYNREKDSQFELLRLKMFMQKRTMAGVFADNTKQASSERSENLRASRTLNQYVDPSSSVTSIGADSDLSAFLGNDVAILYETDEVYPEEPQ